MPPLGLIPEPSVVTTPPPPPSAMERLSAATDSLVGRPMNLASLNQLQRTAQQALASLQYTGHLMTFSNSSTTSTALVSNSDVWPAWNMNVSVTGGSGSATSMAIINAATNQVIWTAWIDTAVTTAASTTNALIMQGGTGDALNTFAIVNPVQAAAWGVWNQHYDVIHEAEDDAARIRRYARRNLSDAEVVAELEREKQYRLQAEERQRQALEVQARAERLLRSCLTPEQIEDLEKKNCFYLEIPREDGKKERYRIDRGTHGNVKQLDEKGSIIRSFCVQPEGVPVADSMVTQKLWLESSDETRAKFWETANITHLVREKEVPAHIPRRERHAYARAHGLLH